MRRCMNRVRRIWVLLVAAFLGAGMAGCARDVNPPIISDVQVDPKVLSFLGGDVIIRAKVTDGSGIAGVEAVILKPDLSTERISMSRDGERDWYRAVYTAPPNLRADGKEEDYLVFIRAVDMATPANKTPDPGIPQTGVKFTVNAPVAAPKPPF